MATGTFKKETSWKETFNLGTIAVGGSAKKTITLPTSGTYVDRNIEIEVTAAAAGSGSLTPAEISKDTVTPSDTAQTVTISSGYIASPETITIEATPTGTLSSGTGSATASSGNITLGSKTTTKPSSGAYITVTGSGSAKVTKAGWLALDEEKSASQTAYYPITSRTLNESAISYESNITGDVDGVDSLSVTVTLPEGYYAGGTQVTKDITDILPNFVTGTDEATSDSMLNGYVAYNDEGQKITGNISTVAPTINLNLGSNTSSGTIDGGKAIKIPKGYISADLYYLAKSYSASDFASGDVTITQKSGQSVVGKSTATVQDAGAATVTPKANTNVVTIGSTVTSGYYPVTSLIEAESSHASAGWVTTAKETGSATIQVGKVAAGSVTPNQASATATETTKLDKNTYITIGAGYYPSAKVYQVKNYSASDFASGAVTITQKTGQSVVGYATATVQDGSAAVSANTGGTAPSVAITHQKSGINILESGTSAYYCTASATPKAGAVGYKLTKTAGWIDAGTPTGTLATAAPEVTGTGTIYFADTAITGSAEVDKNSAASTYNDPALAEASSTIPQVKLTGSGDADEGSVYNGENTAAEKYINYYTGGYTIA